MQSVSYSISEIARAVNGEMFNTPNPEERITDILIDSRRLISPEHCMFIALVTRKNDGHKYIDELHEKGIRNFIISDPEYTREDSNCIRVDNTLDALQKVTAFHRKKFDIPLWLLKKYNDTLDYNRLDPSSSLKIPLVKEI